MPADHRSNHRATGQLAGQAAIGAVVGFAVLGGLLATNAVGLLTLLRSVEGGGLALLMLAFQFGIGFATFAVVTALAFAPACASRRHGNPHVQWWRGTGAWRRPGRG